MPSKIAPRLYDYDPPQKPWNERREDVLAVIDSAWRGCIIRPKPMSYRYPDRRRFQRDVERLVDEGVLKVVRVAGRGSRGYTLVQRAIPLPSPPTPEIREPYSKRRAAIKEFKDANANR